MARKKYVTKIIIERPDFAQQAMLVCYAIELIQKQGWTANRFAATPYGTKTSPLAVDAYVYSIEGALMKAAHWFKWSKELYSKELSEPLKEWMVRKELITPSERPQNWNDEQCEGKEDCIALMDAYARTRKLLWAKKAGRVLAPRG